jgi:hypothetical protein
LGWLFLLTHRGRLGEDDSPTTFAPGPADPASIT